MTLSSIPPIREYYVEEINDSLVDQYIVLKGRYHSKGPVAGGQVLGYCHPTNIALSDQSNIYFICTQLSGIGNINEGDTVGLIGYLRKDATGFKFETRAIDPGKNYPVSRRTLEEGRFNLDFWFERLSNGNVLFKLGLRYLYASTRTFELLNGHLFNFAIWDDYNNYGDWSKAIWTLLETRDMSQRESPYIIKQGGSDTYAIEWDGLDNNGDLVPFGKILTAAGRVEIFPHEPTDPIRFIRRGEVIPVLKANFTASPEMGEAPLQVQFVSTSEGKVLGYNWNFGDGFSTPERNPQHTFMTPGLYTVSLTVMDSFKSDTFEKTIKVLAPSEPEPLPEELKATFTALPTSGDAPLTVQFTDTSIGEVAHWYWKFDDGQLSDEQHPQHTYTKPGVYLVVLTVYTTYRRAEHRSHPLAITVTQDGQLPGEPREPTITEPTVTKPTKPKKNLLPLLLIGGYLLMEGE